MELGSITVSDALQIATLAGDLTITGNIHAGNTGAAAIRLYADYNKLANDATGGNIIIPGSPSITTGAGGRASLYAASPTSSTGLVALAGGTANVRMQADATTATFTPPLGAGIYAIFRADASTLPVSFTAFNVRCNGRKAILNWTTAAEAGNQGFHIEKSADQLQWKTIGFVAGAGDSYTDRHYQFEDAGPVASFTAYRIRQADKNEKFTYSKILAVQCNPADDKLLAVQVFPNPATRQVRLQGLPGNELVSFTVYNQLGISVRAGTVTGAHSTIDLGGQPAGLYLVKLNHGNISKMIRIIKQ